MIILLSLIITGLPETSFAEVASEGTPEMTSGSSFATETTVIEFCRNRLGIELSRQDISTAHRIRGKKDKIRPIIIRFASRRAKDQVYRAKKVLKSSTSVSATASTNMLSAAASSGPIVFINEHLTKKNSELLFEARQRLKKKEIFRCWTSGGSVYIKRNDSVEAKPKRIDSLDDLS